MTKFGFTIWNNSCFYDNITEWILFGFPKIKGHKIDSIYEFENTLKLEINCKGITFHSTYNCFNAYAKNKERLLQFVEQIEEYFANIEKNSDFEYEYENEDEDEKEKEDEYEDDYENEDEYKDEKEEDQDQEQDQYITEEEEEEEEKEE